MSGADTFTPEVNAPGTYFIMVTNSLNGCTAIDELVVDIDTDAPVADAGENMELTCATQTVTLDATNSSAGNNISFLWTTMDGNFLNGEDSLTPEVDQNGTYTLTIINDDNGCETISSVEVTLNNVAPQIAQGQDQILNCDLTELTLGEINTAAPNYSYDWQTDDGIIAGTTSESTLTIDVAGTYTLTVVDNDNGCTATTEYVISENNDTPDFQIIGDDLLSCDVESIFLESDLSDLADLDFEWTTDDGQIQFGTAPTSIAALASGTYNLTVINLVSGCSNTASITIDQDGDLPVINILDPQEITCDLMEVSLDASNSTDGMDITYTWSTDDGQIIGDPNQAIIDVAAPGTYTLNIINQSNGCSSSDEITVGSNLMMPEVTIDMPGQLSCTVDEVMLTANADANQNLDFSWSANPGNIISGDDGLQPMVNQPGIYTVIVTDLNNGCTNEASIQVDQDDDSPIAFIEEAANINCANETSVLDASSSSNGTNFEFNWTTDTGSFLSGENTLSPEVNAAGTYTLIITNTVNNCEISTSVSIEEDLEQPTVDAGLSLQLDCANETVFLDGSQSDNGTEFDILWTTSDGNLVSGENTLSPEVNQAGTYVLTIVNTENDCSDAAPVLITENFDTPQITLVDPGALDCETMQVDLLLQGLDPQQTYDIVWDSQDANFDIGVDNESLIINEAGTFEVVVTNLSSSCSATASISIESIAAIPELSIEEPAMLTCQAAEITLTSITNETGLDYLWTTADGNITSGSDGPIATIDQAGTYVLEIFNLSNECTNTAQVIVDSNVDEPVLNLMVEENITCIQEEGIISLLGSEIGMDFPNNTFIINGPGQFSIDNANNILIVDQAGTYEINVINGLSGCSVSQSITVEEDIAFPLVSIADPEILTCLRTQTTIFANTSGASGLTYDWTTSNGNIVSDDGEALEVDQAGTYNLTITNIDNGCQEFFEIEVLENMESPLIDAGIGFELNCNMEEEALDASLMNPENFDINWFTSNGNILSGEDGLNPLVNQTGTYFMEVIDPTNGCVSLDSVLVRLNEDIPFEILNEVNPPLCFGDNGGLQILDVNGGEGPYVFAINGGEFSTEPAFEDLTPGESYVLSIQDLNGCNLDTILLLPNVEPVQVNLIPEVELNIGQDHQMNVNVNIPESEISQIIWTPEEFLSCTSCLNPIASPLTDITYEVTVINENGCSEKASIVLRVDREIGIYVPNAFSPHNEDGINDVFTIFSEEGTIESVESFQVYDRWGTKVFERMDFLPDELENGWKGDFRGKRLQAQVFVWLASVRLVTGETLLLEGDVSLID